MTKRMRDGITAALVVIALGQPALAQQQEAIKAPPVPPNIEVPAGNIAFLQGHAVGTQNYICLQSASGPAWTFIGPQATLFLIFRFHNDTIQQQITTHFLSPNPAESGMPRATWQSSFDTSAVWAGAIASSTDPNFVAPGAIPWLLLRAVGARSGPTGGDFLTKTTFIQRLNTSGGIIPSTDCSQSTNVGTTAFVPYIADYFFYRARR
jgi:hypothetical protein